MIPNKIIGIAKNYPTKQLPYPIFFTKPWSSILSSSTSQVIKLKKEFSLSTNYEFELGVIIGKTTKSIKEKDYKDYIGGYILALDLTEKTRNPMMTKTSDSQLISKGLDGYTPIGKFIEKEKIPDPNEVYMELYVNNQLVQNGKTGDLVYKISQQMVMLSEYMVLNKGDILLSGTYNNINIIRPKDRIHGVSYINSNNNNEKRLISEIRFEVQEE